MTKRISVVLVVLFSLTACVSDTPYLDSKFGQALQEGLSAQTINTQTSSPDDQFLARELKKGTDSYMTGSAVTPALQGASGQGGSYSSTR